MVGPSPLHYNIHLEPELVNFTFSGKVEILIQAEIETTEIHLNAKSLEIHDCLEGKIKNPRQCEFKLKSESEELIVILPRRITGQFYLEISFSGTINDKLVGLYRSQYSVDGKKGYFAVTQFEETDARMAFPCFDDPAKKATFDIEFLIDEDLKGIANTPESSVERLGNGKKLVKFERTPKMSTYLLFFGIGDFEFIESNANGLTVRVATPPGHTQYGNLALDFGRKSLEFGENYTGIKYPIKKCDFIAVSDFAFGAMENWGAITFRENLLLYYPGKTSKKQMQRLIEVIAHEVAHMWFGDLVSPAEWKYIWLNESFASLFTYSIPDYYFPDRKIWERFVADETINALWRDCLDFTFPIELPEEGRTRINEATYEIIYNKGACVLRMLEGYLGEEKFQQGINHFLGKYQYANATSHDYWTAFEEATGEPIQNFAETWVYKPGYPIIDVKREGHKLVLNQRRFSLLNTSYDQTWVIPLTYRVIKKDGTSETEREIFDHGRLELNIPDGTEYLKLNVDQMGFYRVNYEPDERENLGKAILEGKMPVYDRFGIENDLFAQVLAGEASLKEYLRFVSTYYGKEQDYLPLLSLCGNLQSACIIFQDQAESVKGVGLTLLGKLFEEIGLDPLPEDSFLLSTLRSTLLWTAFVMGDAKVTEWGLEKFEILLNGGNVNEDIREAVLRIAAAKHQLASRYLMDKLDLEGVTEEEKIQILYALGCFEDPSSVITALDYTLKHIPLKNRYVPIAVASRNPRVIPQLWEWYKGHIKPLEELPPMHYERVVSMIVPFAGIGRETKVREFFAGYSQEKDLARDAIKMALERLEVYSKLQSL